MLACYIFQMMRFIDNKPIICRQKLMTCLNIRKQLGVICNNNIGNPSFMLRFMVKAFTKPWTVSAKARIRFACHRFPEVAAPIAHIQFLIIAGLRLCQPDDHLSCRHHLIFGCCEVSSVYFMFKFAQTQIVLSSLKNRCTKRKWNHFSKHRKIPLSKLFLQIYRMGADHHFFILLYTMINSWQKIT
ncbi:hypothetical protein D3C78_828780 [compost metagenome]